jgi:hypothetical protein
MRLKQYVVSAALLACVVLAPMKGFAFTSVTISTKTAIAQLTALGQSSMTVTLANLTSGSTTQIYWSNITLPVGWVDASSYIALSSTNTNAGSGIQIYTDNQGVGANPAYTGAAGTNPEGLVNASSTTVTLPLAWSIVASTAGVANSATTATAADNPTNCGGSDPVGTACLWNFFEDKNTPSIPAQNTPAFANGAQFVDLIQAGAGLHVTQGASGFTPNGSPPYSVVFVEANFAAAATPVTYQTSTLRIEDFNP